MSSFRVIKEYTHKHKKDTLFVLLFRDGQNFGVDVTNSVAGFGRATFDSKEKAQYVFEHLNHLIHDTNNYVRSCELCDSALKGKDFTDIVLYLHTSGKYISKNEMYALIFMLGLNKSEKRLGETGHIISVNRADEDDVIGNFIYSNDKGAYYFVYS